VHPHRTGEYVAGAVLWLALTNPAGKFAALLLLGFAVFISAKRFMGITVNTSTSRKGQ